MLRSGQRDVALAIIGALVFLACKGSGTEDTLEAALIQEVAQGDLVEEIIESGKIAPWYEVKIKPRVSGEVLTVEVEEGERVVEGQRLITLEATDYKRQVELTRIDLHEAELKVEKAERDLHRCQASFDAQALAETELDDARYALDIAKVSVDRARVRLSTQLDQLGYTTLVSPMDGIITRRNVEPGEMVTAGITATVNGEPLLTVAQLDKLQLELSLNQVDVARVETDQEATIILDAYRDTHVQGVVTNIAAAAHSDPAKGIDVFKVKISLDPSQAKLEIKPGMTAEVRIHVGVSKKVVKVPLETVFEDDGSYFIYIVKDDPSAPQGLAKEKVPVTLGRRGIREVEIASGLSPGQRIYVKGDTKDLEIKM